MEMKYFSKVSLILFAFGIFIFSSCKKKEKYPVEPEISYKQFDKFGADSAHIIISFTDGDGDIGLTQSDTVEPYLFNFYTKYFQKKNGVFVEKVLPIPLNYRIPILNTRSKPHSLSGDIQITFLKPYYFPTTTKDTIQYEIYIKDRSLHESNHITTDEIIVGN